MLFHRERKQVPLLNTTSTADISFMLLILFLVTTSMDIDKGLSRQLPPQDPTEEEQPMDVEEGRVLKLEIGSDNTLSCNGNELQISQLQQMVEKHVMKNGKEHVIQLTCNRQASYDAYFKVQDILVRAYTNLRNSLAMKRYGRPYNKCDDTQQEKLRGEVPQRISEVYLSAEGGEP